MTKNEKIILGILSILIIVIIGKTVIHPQWIYGWEDIDQKRADSVVGAYRCSEPEYDATCSGCYAKYPEKAQPWGCQQAEEDRCFLETTHLNGWLAGNYSDCNFFSTSNDRGETCQLLYCNTCPLDLIEIPGIVGVSAGICVAPECTIGSTQSKICGDGSTIITHKCPNQFWNATNNICCDVEGKVRYCENDVSIVEYRCENQDWAKINDCPGVAPSEPSGITLISSVSKYICWDNSKVDDQSKCPEPPAGTQTVKGYECKDGSIQTDRSECYPFLSGTTIVVLLLIFGLIIYYFGFEMGPKKGFFQK